MIVDSIVTHLNEVHYVIFVQLLESDQNFLFFFDDMIELNAVCVNKYLYV